LDKTINGHYEAKRCFNIVTNTFDLVFKRIGQKLPNNIKRLCTLSIYKLKGKESLSETKKILGWDINSRLLRIALPLLKGNKWSTMVQKFIT